MRLETTEVTEYTAPMANREAANGDDAKRARALHEEAAELRRKADAIEKGAVRLALEVAGWLERPAAELLGMSKTGFRHLVDKHGLRGELEAAREAMGYSRGRPR